MTLSHFIQINPKNLQRFSKRSVYFTRPRVICVYDIQEDGKISPAKQLQYFREPKSSEYPLDLNEAFDTYCFSPIPHETKVLLALQHEMTGSEAEKAKANNKCIDRIERTSVYTRRGTLRYIMEFCYAHKFDGNVLISRHGGKLYLFERNDEIQDHEKTPVYTHHSRLCRQLFVDDPNVLPDFDKPYKDYDSQHILLRSNLGKFDITYASELKGILPDGNFNKVNDLKAVHRKRFVMAKQMWCYLKNHDMKLMNYWTQAYLANVNDLYIAYKDKGGVVREPIEHLKVSEIPKGRRWKPGVCTAFLNEFLERVEHLMWNVDSFETVYEFHFKAKDNIIQYEIHKGKPEKILVPKEYIEFAKKRGC